MIVEGYLDVIGPYQAGFKNCVSPKVPPDGRPVPPEQTLFAQDRLALDPDAPVKRHPTRASRPPQEMDREGDVAFDAAA